MKALVVGWFSFEQSDSTAGDFLVCDVVGSWLAEAGLAYDVALATPFRGGVSLGTVRAADYHIIAFVCGPFMRNHWEAAFFGQFADRPIIGVNLSLPVSLDEWNLFDALVERDSDRRSHPDLAFASTAALVPVVGLCLVEPYAEAQVPLANEAIEALCRSRGAAIVPIDTRLDVNQSGLRTPAEVESVLARMDAVITTRLHGTVLALKHGVPPLVVDPEPGGGRIKRQAESVGWRIVFTVDDLRLDRLQQAFDYCLSADARAEARGCATRALPIIERVKQEFLSSLALADPSPKRSARLDFARRYASL